MDTTLDVASTPLFLLCGLTIAAAAYPEAWGPTCTEVGVLS